MDITGARWGLAGAEAILNYAPDQATATSTQYWTFHLAQEHRRVHESRYLNHAIPSIT